MLVAVLCVLVVVLAIAYVVIKRRPVAAPDPMDWREQRFEPWGSIILGVWFVGSAVAGLGRVFNQRWIGVVVVIAVVVGLPWMLIAASRQVRQISIRGGAIEWRTLRQRWSAPMSEVVAVSGPHRHPPQFQLADGRVIRLPEAPGVRAVTLTLVEEFGASELPPDLDGWDCDGCPEPFERMAPQVREAKARAIVRRRTRKDLDLSGDASVHVVATGPPYVSLERRAELLGRCRGAMTGRGFRIASARSIEPDTTEWLKGDRAGRAAIDDERCADTDGHWWIHDLVWHDEHETTIFVPVDLDDVDLVFVGWGPRAVEALSAVRVQIEACRI